MVSFFMLLLFFTIVGHQQRFLVLETLEVEEVSVVVTEVDHLEDMEQGVVDCLMDMGSRVVECPEDEDMAVLEDIIGALVQASEDMVAIVEDLVAHTVVEDTVEIEDLVGQIEDLVDQ